VFFHTSRELQIQENEGNQPSLSCTWHFSLFLPSYSLPLLHSGQYEMDTLVLLEHEKDYKGCNYWTTNYSMLFSSQSQILLLPLPMGTSSSTNHCTYPLARTIESESSRSLSLRQHLSFNSSIHTTRPGPSMTRGPNSYQTETRTIVGMEGGFRSTRRTDSSLTTYCDELFQSTDVERWFADRERNNILGRSIVNQDQDNLLRIIPDTESRDVLLV